VSCQVEHPTLLSMARQNIVPIVGFDWKDKPGTAIQWLAKQGGDPYALSVMDLDGRVAIDYGVYGAPETFVIDRNGVIRMKHIGPLDDKTVADKLLPMIRKLSQ
jgi:cytochrome c biogenesis protein CcmG/thiol:disulfide interchange protein DsbE